MLEKWSDPYTAPGNSWIESIIFAVIYLLIPQNLLFLVSPEFRSVYAILYMINYFKPYHLFPRAHVCRYYIVISMANVKTSYSLKIQKRFDLPRTLSQIRFVFYCGKRTFNSESFFLRTVNLWRRKLPWSLEPLLNRYLTYISPWFTFTTSSYAQTSIALSNHQPWALYLKSIMFYVTPQFFLGLVVFA